MKTRAIHLITKQVIVYEVIAIVCIIALIWFDEIIDLPHMLFGAESTPLNWQESLFESIIIAVLGAATVLIMRMLFRRIKYLEGILSVCASCKKIRDDQGHWHQIEDFIRDRSEAEFSHSICPNCAKTLYPDIDLDEIE